MKKNILYIALLAITSIANATPDENKQYQRETQNKITIIESEIKEIKEAHEKNEYAAKESTYEILKKIEGITEKSKQDQSIHRAKEESEKEITNKSIEYIEKTVTLQNTRIDQTINTINLALTIISAFLVLTGFITFFSATKKAEEEAREAAELWFQQNTADLKERVTELTASAKSVFENYISLMDSLRTEAIEKLEKSMHAVLNGNTNLSQIDQEALEKAAQKAAQKPDNELTFTDWNSRAFNAIKNSDYSSAIEFWRKAKESFDATQKQIMSAEVNSAIAYRKIGEYGTAIILSEKIIKELDGDNSPEAIEQKALALMNISSCTLKTENIQKAKENLDLAEKALGQITDERAQDYLTSISLNLANTLQKTSPNEALELCKRGQERSQESTTQHGRNNLTGAINLEGYITLMEAKKIWENQEKSIQEIKKALEIFKTAHKLNPAEKIITGNIYYAEYLLGTSLQETVSRFKELLESGEESLFNGTIEDLESNPIPAVDLPLKLEINNLWQRRANKT